MFLFINVFSAQISYISTSFKYISCSYLSSSHFPMFIILNNSNTSHVLIYQSTHHRTALLPAIQIHLMFLFIGFFVPASLDFVKFKYISCSYLSVCLAVPYIHFSIQIHLMFLFIKNAVQEKINCNYSNTSHVLIYLVCY